MMGKWLYIFIFFVKMLEIHVKSSLIGFMILQFIFKSCNIGYMILKYKFNSCIQILSYWLYDFKIIDLILKGIGFGRIFMLKIQKMKF